MNPARQLRRRRRRQGGLTTFTDGPAGPCPPGPHPCLYANPTGKHLMPTDMTPTDMTPTDMTPTDVHFDEWGVEAS